jgi:hypothetical protein
MGGERRNGFLWAQILLPQYRLFYTFSNKTPPQTPFSLLAIYEILKTHDFSRISHGRHHFDF